MEKAEKVKIVDELIGKAIKLTYDINSHPQTHVVNDALSFVRNILEEKNAIQWDNEIRHIYWGVSLANSPLAENTRVIRWHNGKDKFIGILKSIKQEIELFVFDNIGSTSSTNGTTSNTPIIFLSHSSTDKPYGDALEKVISGLGDKNEQLIYTLHPLHKIPLDKNIYDYLRENINNNILTIFLWSDNYLDSPACLNEMGAAWVTQSDYTNIFTPDFNFGNP